MAQLVKNVPAMRETWVQFLGWEDSPGKGKGYPLQYSGLENSMDCIVRGVTKSCTRLSEYHTSYELQQCFIYNSHFTVDKYFVSTLSTVCFLLHYSILTLILMVILKGRQGRSCNVQLTAKKKLSEMLY